MSLEELQVKTYRVQSFLASYEVDEEGVMEPAASEDLPPRIRQVIADLAWGQTNAPLKAGARVSLVAEFELPVEDHANELTRR